MSESAILSLGPGGLRLEPIERALPAPDFEVFVPGIPRPQGSKIRTRYGMRDASDYLKVWRNTVHSEAAIAKLKAGGMASTTLLDGPLVLGVEFLFERPQKHFHWTSSHGVRMRQGLRDNAPTYVTSTPDLDKCLRAVKDAGKTAGLYGDDSQVVGFAGFPLTAKRYANPGEQPGARIRIWRVT